MTSIRLALLCSLGVWALQFVVAMVVFPLRDDERPLFESIMPVALAAAVVLFSAVYFRNVRRGQFREGMLLGLLFLGASILIDLPLFSRGPMAMTLTEYVKDIAVTYLLMPVVTAGFGYLLQTQARQRESMLTHHEQAQQRPQTATQFP